MVTSSLKTGRSYITTLGPALVHSEYAVYLNGMPIGSVFGNPSIVDEVLYLRDVVVKAANLAFPEPVDGLNLHVTALGASLYVTTTVGGTA